MSLVIDHLYECDNPVVACTSFYNEALCSPKILHLDRYIYVGGGEAVANAAFVVSLHPFDVNLCMKHVSRYNLLIWLVLSFSISNKYCFLRRISPNERYRLESYQLSPLLTHKLNPYLQHYQCYKPLSIEY